MIKAGLSSLHLEEAVKQGRLAVLNHDMPDFNLHRHTVSALSFSSRAPTWPKMLPLTTEP